MAIVLAKTIKYTLFILQGINNSSANNTIALLNKQTDRQMKCPRNKIATVGTLSEGHQAKALKAFDEMRAEPAWMSRGSKGGKDGQETGQATAMHCVAN